MNETSQRKLNSANEVLAKAQQLAASLSSAIDATKEELARINSLETLKQEDLLKRENLSRQLAKLESSAKSTAGDLSLAQAAIGEAESALEKENLESMKMRAYEEGRELAAWGGNLAVEIQAKLAAHRSLCENVQRRSHRLYPDSGIRGPPDTGFNNVPLDQGPARLFEGFARGLVHLEDRARNQRLWARDHEAELARERMRLGLRDSLGHVAESPRG
jgi:hypothetical protein